MSILVYFILIILANVLTAKFAPIHVGTLVITVGSFFVGANFVARDFVQLKYGRRIAYFAIFGALLTSGLCSYFLNDPVTIAVASAITFLLSETADTEIFTRLKQNILKRVWVSGLVSLLIDSVVFILIGLSPLFSNIIPWEYVGWAIISQVLIKGVSLLACCALIKAGKLDYFYQNKQTA